MNNQSLKLLRLICSNLDEVTDIRASGTEYYFCFRMRFFSVLWIQETSKYSLIAYPKWRTDTVQLVNFMDRGIQEPETAYVYLISNQEDEKVRELYDWLKRRETGLDELFADLGVG